MWLETIKEIAGFVLSAILITVIVLWSIVYITTYGDIAAFKSIQKTINIARANKDINSFELAALQQKVVDGNEWLAKQKYWNGTLLEWFIPDEIEKLEPIK